MRQILFFGLVTLLACGEEEKETTDSPPELISLEIQSSRPALTNSLLRCVARAADADGDLITLTYQWLNQNDEVLGRERDLHLDSSIVQPEDILRCELQITANEKSVTGTAEIQIDNSAPVIELFTVSPEAVYVDSLIEIELAVSDLDGEEPSIRYAWYNNNVELEEDGASLALDAENFSDGDVIKIRAEASDDYGGIASEMMEIEIGNTAPILAGVELSPNPLYSYQEITCSPTEVFDLEGDEVFFAYQWFINQELQLETSSQLLSPLAVNDDILCVVTPNDSKQEGDAVSATITVENSIPVIDAFSITPVEAYTDSELSCLAAASDLDQEELNISYQWTTAAGTILSNNSILSELSSSLGLGVNDEVSCTVTVRDPNGGVVTDSLSTIILNTNPIVQAASIISGTATTSSVLTCSAAFTDIDDGILIPAYEWSKSDGTILGSTSSYTIDSLDTDPEDELFCSASVTDSNGAFIESVASIVIENTEPTITAVDITENSMYTNDTIVATVALEDLDGDQQLEVNYVWHVIDSSEEGEERTINTGADNTLFGGAPEHHFGKEDQVFVVVTPHDGVSEGDSAVSSSVNILNSIPTTPNINIIGSTNAIPLAEEDDLHCQIDVVSTDEDPEDSVTYDYIWTDPAGNIVSQVNSADSENILWAAQPTSYGTWSCEVSASDGDDSSSSVRSEIFVDYDCHCPVANAQDYAFTYWPENFRHPSFGANGYQVDRHFLTGFYGLEIDLTTASLTKAGQWIGSGDILSDILTENTLIDSFLSSSLEYSVSIGQDSYLATDFLNSTVTGSHADLNPSELNDMGRFMQQIEIPEVYYGSQTDIEGRVAIASAPRHIVFTQVITANVDLHQEFSLALRLDGDLWANAQVDTWLDGARAVQITDQNQDSWVFILPEATDTIRQEQDGSFVFERTISSLSSGQETSLSLMLLPANELSTEQLNMYLNPSAVQIEYAQMDQASQFTSSVAMADWDETLGFYIVPMGGIQGSGANSNGGNWDTYPEHHNVYSRHQLTITHSSSEELAIPILMDGPVNTTFNITGGAGMFRDMNGEPTGLPVQVSKNWHMPGYWPNWHHFYTTASVPAGTHELEFAVTGSKWGEAYAVSHAQLSLVGWGTNQQWDESAMGCWGESITYDPDLTLNRSMVDDVRPFLVNTAGEWGWTGNVGGADFLRYKDESNTLQRLGRMRTHYEAVGPNLTNVIYSGISRDGKVQATIRTHLLRGNDLVRAYYVLDYSLLADVTYSRFSLFQVAADGYADNGFTEAAYGDENGMISNISIPNHGTTGYASELDRGIQITGNAPWTMLFNSTRADGNLPELYADVGFVVRDYELNRNGVIETTPHINIYQTKNGGWSQYAFELGVPYNPSDLTLPAGTTIHAVVEYLVIPNDISLYYGDSEYLLALDSAYFGSTDIMEYLAAENIVSVTPSVGTVTQDVPIIIATDDSSLAAQFTLSGGLGYIPLQFTGLHRYDGWRLERNEQGVWVEIDQAIHGNDFWQAAFDPLTDTYTLIYSVQNDDDYEYRLLRD